MLKTCFAYVCIHTKYYISNTLGYFNKNQDLFTRPEFLNSPPVAHHINFLCYAALRFARFCSVLFRFVAFFLFVFVCLYFFLVFCLLYSLSFFFFISPMWPRSLYSLFFIALSDFSNICSSVNCWNIKIFWVAQSAHSTKWSSIGKWLKKEFEDTKGAIIIHISKKNRQRNGQKTTNTKGQTTIYKTYI